MFAAADTRTKAEQAIRETLTAYLEAHPDCVPTSDVRVACVSDGQRSNVHIVGVRTLLGTGRSLGDPHACWSHRHIHGHRDESGGTGPAP